MIEFRTKLNDAKSSALNKNVFKKLWWLYALLTILLIGIGISALKEDKIFGIIYIGLGLLITPLSYFLVFIIQKRFNKSANYLSDETEEIFTFDEEYMNSLNMPGEVKGDSFSSTLKAKYSIIYKVIEDKNYYFVYISKMQCFVVNKSSITIGTLEEAQALLKKNLGDKFKTK